MTGAIAFLFTDIEASTRLWDRFPAAMERALARHDALLREVVESRGGNVFKTAGDSFCCAFTDPSAAIPAAIEVQRALSVEPWGDTGPLGVRMAIATGEAQSRNGDFFGPALNRVSRLLAAAHGGQILADAISARGTSAETTDLGLHRLRGLEQPERIFHILAPGLRRDFPPPRTMDATPNNLPVDLPPLIGREEVLATALEAIRTGRARLTTFTGTGGVGKTRLAIEIAASLLAERNGAFFVSLASASQVDEIAPAIAGVIGVRESGGQPLIVSLASYLAGLPVVLVLDNLEQIANAGAMISDLMQVCPKIVVIVTSREPLHVRGEREFSIEPLELNSESDREGPAIRLFLERVREVRSGYNPSPPDLIAIREICRRLDGLPLAIELAAARTKLLSPGQILSRLDQRFLLLTGGAKNLPSRQQTLRNAIAWSFDLLGDEERGLLLALSVFAGGWTLEHAEGIAADGVEAIDLLGSLVDKHLVFARVGQDGPRFDMLESIKEFALEQLEASAEAAAARARHARIFQQLAGETHQALAGADQAPWLVRLSCEHANLRQSLAWLLAEEPGGAGPAMTLALVRFWRMKGLLSEGRVWLERSIRARPDADDATRARALDEAGVFAQDLGEFDAAAGMHRRAGAMFAALGDERGLAEVSANLATVELFRGEYEEAERHYADSLSRFAALADRRGVAAALNGLGMVAFWRGDMTGAITFYTRGLEEWRALGDVHSAAIALGNIGHALIALRAIDRAEEVSIESRDLFERIGDPVGVATSTLNLAFVAYHRGELSRATALFTRCGRLGVVHEEPQTTIESLLGLGLVALAAGEVGRGVEFLAATHVRRNRLGLVLSATLQTEFEQAIARARGLVSHDDYAAAWSRGQGVTVNSVFPPGDS